MFKKVFHLVLFVCLVPVIMIAQMFGNETAPEDLDDETEDDMNEEDGRDKARVLIEKLATVPKGSRLIDDVFVEMCATFSGTDAVRFLRDLRDQLVFCGGCADVIIMLISDVLNFYPTETKDEMDARHKILEERHRAPVAHI